MEKNKERTTEQDEKRSKKGVFKQMSYYRKPLRLFHTGIRIRSASISNGIADACRIEKIRTWFRPCRQAVNSVDTETDMDQFEILPDACGGDTSASV